MKFVTVRMWNHHPTTRRQESQYVSVFFRNKMEITSKPDAI
jgi:hypothetical protein